MDSKILNEIIKNRRATPPRFLTQNKISKEIIYRLLENANWAPNHKKTEPWRFKIYSGEAKQKLADDIFSFLTEKIMQGTEINPQKVEKLCETLRRIPVVITIILERDIAKRIPEWEEIAAVSMAVQNMWLTTTSMKLGAFWATPQFMPLLNEILEVKTDQKVLGFFYVGEIAIDYPSPGRGNVELKVEWKE